MEQETLFTASKWEILKLLSEKSLSPIELAARANTSVANISQQLRLLEMAGLVRSERVPNRDKGQPRILYSLAGDHSFLIATTDDFTEKKLLKLSSYNKIILRTWFLEDRKLHYYVEKAFWHIEPLLPSIDALALDLGSTNPLNLIIFTRDAKLKTKLHPLALFGPDGEKRQLLFITTDSDNPSEELGQTTLYPLHDPGTIIPSTKAATVKEGRTNQRRKVEP